MLEIIFEWNPWWSKEYNFDGIKRDKLSEISPWIHRKEIISLIGVRRSGKTTLFYEIIEYLIKKKKINPKNILFVKADDDRINTEELIDKSIDEYKKQICPKSKIFLFIDEIQEIPRWHKILKRIYDLNRDIKIFISGSNASILKEEMGSVLAGRFSYFEIFPFNFTEFLRAKNVDLKGEVNLIKNQHLIRKYLDDYIEYGSFPEVVLENRKKIKKELVGFYFDSIFYRDIIKRKNIRNSAKMEKLVKYLLQNVSNLINFSRAAKLLSLTTDSITEYVKALDEAYLMFNINLFCFSYKKQIINPKKIYCVDTGIRNIVGFKFSRDIGRLYENIVAVELKRRYRDIYYWKNPGQEVDFVIKKGLKVKKLIQVCCTFDDPETKKREIKGLMQASKELKCKSLLLITEKKEGIVSIENKTIKYIPLWKWLLQVNK